MENLFRLAVVSILKKDLEKDPELVNRCVEAVEEAAERGADLVLLPEEPDIVAGEGPGEYALEEHPAYTAFSAAAAQGAIGLVSSLSARVPNGGYANTGFLLDRKGELMGVYRKKHPAPSEEAIVTAPVREGDPFPVFDFEGVKLGIAICMDIHSPEMFRIYGLKGVDLLCMATMYLDYTGDMLESLEKARAIDSQMYFSLSRYVAKPFLAGRNMGYAKVVSPDGRIICSTAHRPGVAIAEFDPKYRMPFWGEGYEGNMRYMFDVVRRPDLYGELLG